MDWQLSSPRPISSMAPHAAGVHPGEPVRTARPGVRVNALPPWRLKRVQALVAASLDDPLRLAGLAAAAGLSPMHFAAQFKAATGQRPHDYLLRQRITRAMHIMMGEDMPLAQVAHAVGFQSQSHFSTVFKRITGETPAAWRRANRR